jgi:hypothetical protein
MLTTDAITWSTRGQLAGGKLVNSMSAEWVRSNLRTVRLCDIARVEKCDVEAGKDFGFEVRAVCQQLLLL